MKWSPTGVLRAADGILNASLYSEAGIDGRRVLADQCRNRVATRVAALPAQYAPVAVLGAGAARGSEVDIGGEQPLRGSVTDGRFYDRKLIFSHTELRRTCLRSDAISHAGDRVGRRCRCRRCFSRWNHFSRQSTPKVGRGWLPGHCATSVVGYVDRLRSDGRLCLRDHYRSSGINGEKNAVDRDGQRLCFRVVAAAAA